MNLFGDGDKQQGSNKKYVEDELQKTCFRFMELQFSEVFIFHVPNGGKRNIKEAGKLKAMGVRRGVSDLISLAARRGYGGFVCELKTEKGSLEPDQKNFLAHAEKENKYTCLCRSFDAFMLHAYYYFGNGKTDKKPQRGY